ncbi:trans-AT polyketide synthase, acyltransferase and oxidoreductase domain-containing protein [Nonomuraea solani]|uniref:Malonyl CoA-acyl carrier protein transacylase n=1 Tax=Nonomuraea solani TaxID=1144553 RepID=A0A1H6EES9_9ACTN|nr:ACP S-malonyltransferase [Nonomuraea solani]SEG95466.1 trans-AT polyketide synthase, acyltransferase and oxidoreductase domain-containing protein [Nonomuraea solani]
MTLAALFPGQGTQQIGMGRDLFPRYPGLVEEADDTLGYSIRRLCLEDPDGVLDRTRFTQPAVYTINALAFRHLADTEEVAPDVMLGHSLGEYNALAAAGAFGFADGLRLIAERARLMDEVRGGMAAVTGLTEDAVRDVIRSGPLDLAAVNAPRQIVLAGPRRELDAVTPALSEAGAAAVTPLPVSGPFHSRYMAPAARRFAEVLEHGPLGREPRVPVLANRTARPHRAETMAAELAEQIDHTVLWAQSVRHVLAGDPDTRLLEVGGDGVLAGLLRQIRRERRVTDESGVRAPSRR